MPTVPTIPAMETSFAARGRAVRTASSIGRSSSRVRPELESH